MKFWNNRLCIGFGIKKFGIFFSVQYYKPNARIFYFDKAFRIEFGKVQPLDSK